MDLNDAFANAAYIPQADDYPPRWAEKAEAFREQMTQKHRARLGVAYGNGPRQEMDIFLPKAAPKGLVVFVHGGYWLRFDRFSWSHLAAGSCAQGWAVAMPSYDLCPQVHIRDITGQIAHAVTLAAREISGPIRLVGHSAGGQQVCRMGAADVLPDTVARRIARIMPISPVADLRPLRHTRMNETLALDDAEAELESPLLAAAPNMPVSVWVGADERPVFVEQATALAAAWQADLTVEPDRHHFDVIDALEDPESPMIRALLGD
ncbi:alpha/beta hydrolase [Primorskyibacter marinus]|uniref:alpha/beta hydrolase n=1 Tax=Primorskyibacter marinus TaxID=1977320 RepID=UPI000E304B63|nr:alpha/beta hydrolase [Primorskyibacter marinus]